MTNRSNNCIGFDQALEKSYNYTSKAIALWDIFKHEIDQFFVHKGYDKHL